MTITEFIESCEPYFNAQIQMIGKVWTSPGYHSTLPTGSYVHSTRETLYYAAALLRSGDAAMEQRAHRVIEAVIALQDQDPTSKTYGIWPWNYEEGLEKMAPPDWNWADFCGGAIALMLHDSAAVLDTAVTQRMRTSLTHAAFSIFRRNVLPGYTNIAIMGGAVTAAAAELLDIPFLLDYGRTRLGNVVKHTKFHGDFNEYNSPTYTMVALEEAERVLHLVKDSECRAHAEALRVHAWRVIADHFHPATAQWAGPNSRTYADYIRGGAARKIARQTGVELRVAVADEGKKSIIEDLPALMAEPPCPPQLIGRFSALPSADHVVQGRFFRNDDEARSIYGYTWLSPQCCLGSVNHDSMWTQRRGLIGYWPAAGDTAPAVFRCRFLKDGKDFASAGIMNRQARNRCLTAVSLISGYGDYHISLDRPTDGVFETTSLVLRFSVHGTGARAENRPAGVYRLICADHAAVVYTLPARFDGRDVAWRTGRDSDEAWVEAVCYEGEPWRFAVAAIAETQLCAGIEITAAAPGATATSAPAPQIPGPRLTTPVASDTILYSLDWASVAVADAASAALSLDVPRRQLIG